MALGSFIGAGRSLGAAIRRVQRAEELGDESVWHRRDPDVQTVAGLGVSHKPVVESWYGQASERPLVETLFDVTSRP